jgi:hypothetical protein
MHVRRSAPIAMLLAASTPAFADERGLEAGVRLITLLGHGVPANDMPGFGVIGRWHWRPAWQLGVAVDQLTFDYERPYAVLGIASTMEIDASNDLTRFSAWLERRYDAHDAGWSFFWLAGAGYATVGTETVTGFTPSGARWEIETEASDELHVLGSTGVRRHFGPRLSVELALHLEQHGSDYRVRDRVSGSSATIGSHGVWGASIAMSHRF